jgi:SAM-dependent methyltransferase
MGRRVVSEGMRAYYDRRALEYDDWWRGTGRFARRVRPDWAQEVQRLLKVVGGLAPARVLDAGCGTGFLTRHLRGDLVALDQSPQMVEVAAARIPGARVVQGDAVPLPFRAQEFDRVFTSHFYGHLHDGEREEFVAEARRVGRELVVVDSARTADTGAEQWQQRVLNDGSVHRVYKRYFGGTELVAELGGGEILHDGDWFVVVVA